MDIIISLPESGLGELLVATNKIQNLTIQSQNVCNVASMWYGI
jgi:hypothetical protein